MMSVTSDLFQIGLYAVGSLFGAGVVWGAMKGKVDTIQTRIVKIEDRQSRLRGENNGGAPLFIAPDRCRELRVTCHERESTLLDDMEKHTVTINRLERFARWALQKEGLSPKEINEVLGND